MRLYVAGPYSAPTPEGRVENTNRAIDVGIALMEMGHYPFIPHLTHWVEQRMIETKTLLFEVGTDENWQHWLDQDESWLDVCDGLFKIKASKGADREEARMRAAGKPVYYSLSEVPAVGPVVGHPRFRELLDEAWRLHCFKAKKYGSATDPLANLHSVRFGLRPYQSCLVALNDISIRLDNLIRQVEAGGDPAEIDDEPLRNALLDQAAYSYLAIILLEEAGLVR